MTPSRRGGRLDQAVGALARRSPGPATARAPVSTARNSCLPVRRSTRRRLVGRRRRRCQRGGRRCRAGRGRAALHRARSLEHPGMRFGELRPRARTRNTSCRRNPPREACRWEAMPAQERPVYPPGEDSPWGALSGTPVSARGSPAQKPRFGAGSGGDAGRRGCNTDRRRCARSHTALRLPSVTIVGSTVLPEREFPDGSDGRLPTLGSTSTDSNGPLCRRQLRMFSRSRYVA
jgi:hypothetical protein